MGGPRSFNFADVWEMAADRVPEREALVVGTQRRTYAELEERANRLADHFARAGIGPGDHVAAYLYNGSEFLETMLAAFKLRAAVVNVNYRYVAAELAYVLADSDARAIVYDPRFTATLDEVASELGKLTERLAIGDDYEAALAAASPVRLISGWTGDAAASAAS